MTEQFGAIPVRAFGDTKLSAADLRILGAIAYFDRFGRNGYGCIADPGKIAEIAAVNYKNLGRHTKHLKERGYIQIVRSATDRRKRGYALIYNEDQVVVVNSDDNRGRDDDREDIVSPVGEIVVNAEDNPTEIVVKPSSQVIDPPAKSDAKRSCKTELRDPAKPRGTRAQNPGQRVRGLSTGDHKDARQADRGGGKSRAQGHFMPPINWANQPQRNQLRAPDWNGWAAWLQREQGMTKEEAWALLMARLERIETERDVDSIKAGAILDRELRRRRKLAA